MDVAEEQFASAILPSSSHVDKSLPEVRGPDFNKFAKMGISVAELVDALGHTGHQASNLKHAADIVNDIQTWPLDTSGEISDSPNQVFLGATSNLVSSGLRETIRWLVEHRHVTVLVMTAGAVEEDLIKCLAPTYVGTAQADDAQLRENAVNRIYNLRVPNDNYCLFEEWLTPQLWKCLEKQEREQNKFFDLRQRIFCEMLGNTARTGRNAATLTEAQRQLREMKLFTWAPSHLIEVLGAAINDNTSICYWASKNRIPVFCPAITDGSLGDILSMFQMRARSRNAFEYNPMHGRFYGPVAPYHPDNPPVPDPPPSDEGLRPTTGKHHPASCGRCYGEDKDDEAAEDINRQRLEMKINPCPHSVNLHFKGLNLYNTDISRASSTWPYPVSETGLIVDIAADIDRLNTITREIALRSRNHSDLYRYKPKEKQPTIPHARMAAIVLGSGLVKHHIMNACLNGGGADAVVYMNTATESDGSDAGAGVSEAVSWGKAKADAKMVKVWGDATILFPMLVAASWAKDQGELVARQQTEEATEVSGEKA